MSTLLVINPNTSVTVTAMLQHHVHQALGPTVQVRTLTARFGATYIASEASYAVAHHAVLDAWAVAVSQGPSPDAVLIGCFGDPGLFALREGAGVPVGGLADAAFAAAARYGRFAIVTGGERWRPMLERLAVSLGHGAALAGIHTVAPSGSELAAEPARARRLLTQACQEAAARFDAQAIILGGAGLAGMAEQIAPELSLPVIDSVIAGAQWAAEAMQQPAQRHASTNFGVTWDNLSWEMTALR
ncbi:aspartate/glutamate racemase family protein [Variovorax dokdonensis]|uniref:Aspartate/glutamate racemase family protein n=1 Tax=Variovorax dokdonensis TaxID=344883 RepID=A0ABT7NFP9_9BURK|nr:aspartate/glutamate racemase family protein [Variovorax dokdonensis]MDM0046766.1 aspartate/glutamate racemase family protein [Variovorax dokdonensis]